MESKLLTAEDVASQLRIKKYTVYELIKRGELPSSRVGKQVRISQADIEKYLAAGRTGPGGAASIQEEAKGEAAAPARQVIISGQDRCLEFLFAKIANETGSPALRSYTGCYSSLIALYFGKITMAASHLWDGETDTYNYPFIRRLLPGLPVGVLRLAGRMQGFYVKKGNPLGLGDWKDLARPELTMINRERGCGTRILLDQKLAALGIDTGTIRGYNWESSSHLGCAGIVARGGADLGCGCEGGAADMAGLDFVPLQLEWYDFVFRLADRNIPALKAVLAYVSSGEFRRDLEVMGGYDLSRTGDYEEFC
ncbi:MAG: helix-turn-helix transcriptional regulator [Treponema sp.]|jgi:putative molybdopterin biosynthesis protein|nr:helix-turn-helix transcriptional regulator [Treponema sp.]